MAFSLAGGFSIERSSQFSIYSLKKLLGYTDIVEPHVGMGLSAKWMVDNWGKLDHAQMQVLMADPLDYVIEDQLIASAKNWHDEVVSSIPEPVVPELSSANDWRGAFNPNTES